MTKKLRRVFVSMLLVLTVITALIPFTTMTANAWSLTTPEYITDIGIAYANKKLGESGNDAANRAKKLLTDNGYTVVDQDLNEDAGGAYIYMGYKTSTDYSRAITGMFLWVGDKDNKPDRYQKGSTWFYLVGGSYEGNGTGDGAVDLNEGAGGKYIYLYITRDTDYDGGYPLMEIQVQYYKVGGDYKVAQSFDGSALNLNEGTKSTSKAIYLHYKTFAEYTQRDEEKHLTYTTTLNIKFNYLDADGKFQSTTKSKTVRNHEDKFTVSGVDVPQTVTVNGYTLSFAGWRSDYNGYDPQTTEFSTTFMDGTGHESKAKFAIAVYSGNVTVTYDANGGTGAPVAQTLTVKSRAQSSVAINGTATFTLSSTKPVNSSLHDFLGWSTDKNATTAQYTAGQKVEFKKNTTLYAVYATHPYSDKWTSNSTHHWHDSTCDHSATTDYGAHDYTDATCTQPKTCKVCGYQTGSALGHDCRYSADGSMITQTCTRCTHRETATIDVTGERRYTGSALEPCTVVYSSGWYGAKNYELKYKNNVNVGTAQCYIQQNGVYAYLDFVIEKGVFSGIWASGENVTYDGKEHCITVHGVPEGATVYYNSNKYPLGGWYTGGRYNYVGPDVGSYRVNYKVSKDSYESYEGYAYVNISKATNAWETEPSITGWTYGETPATPNMGVAKFGSVKVQYKSKGAEDSQYTATVPTDAGDYIARFYVDGNGNYTGISVEKNFTVARAQVSVKVHDKNKTYGEADPELTWELTGGTVFGSDNLLIDLVRESGENVKEYNIVQSENSTNQNYDITFVNGTFTINKKTIGIVWGDVSFVYDSNEKLPKATATGMEFEDELELTVGEAQINVGSYIATVTDITGKNASNYQLPDNVTMEFSIVKAEQAAPDIDVIHETIDGKKDGRIIGVDSTMEYRAEGKEEYSAIYGTEIENLADGTYYIRYKENSNYNASNDTIIVLKQGRKLSLTVPINQIGYALTVDKTELAWNDTFEITFVLKNGYTACEGFAVKVNGTAVELNNGKFTVANVQSDTVVTVEGVADVTAPDVTVVLGTNNWNKFWNSITFGLFFKDTQRVTITAEDNGSGINKLYYYLATEVLSEEQIKALESGNWTEYTGAFNLNPQDEYIIYAKAVDNDNNIKYVSSEYGIVIDSIAPVIFGIANGETHYGDTSFTVSDKHIDVVTVDGKNVMLDSMGKYTIIADGLEHTVLVTDKSGNQSALIKITVITIASLDDSIDDITTDNVKSSDKPEIEAVKAFVESLIANDKQFTAEEQSQLEEMKANTEALLGKLSDVAAEIDALKAAVNSYDINKVKSDDKNAINALIARINTLLNGDNLTSDEKAALTRLNATAEKLIKKIDEVAKNRAELTAKVNAYDREKVTSNDKKNINSLIADIDKLLSGNNINAAERKELGDLKNTAEKLVKRIDEIAVEIKSVTDAVNSYDEATVKSDNKQEIEKLIDRIDTVLATKNITDEERSALESLKNTAEKLIKKTDDIATEIKSVTDAVNGYDEETVKSDNKQEIEKLIDRIDTVLATKNITDEERSALESLKNTAEKLIKKIDDIATEIKSVTDAVNGYDGETVKSEDKQEIEKLIDRIDTVLATENITDEERSALESLKNTAEKLVKKTEEIAAEIRSIEDAVNGYDKETVTSDDKREMEKLIDRISALFDTENITDEERNTLESLKKVAEELIERINEVAKAIADLADKVNAYDKNKVTSNDKQTVSDLIRDIDELLNGNNINATEKDTLEELKAAANELIDRIEAAISSTDADNINDVKDITADNVKTENKSDLETALDDLEKALEDYYDNLTDEEKNALQTDIDRIQDGLDIIHNVENFEDLVNKLPDNIKNKDSDAVNEADDAYNALSEYEKSIVDENAKMKLDSAKAELENVHKTQQIILWSIIAVLVLLCIAFIIIVCKKKKESLAK